MSRPPPTPPTPGPATTRSSAGSSTASATRLGVVWSHDHDPRPVGTPAPWIGSKQPLADRAAVEREHLEVLERLIGRAVRAASTGPRSGVQVGTAARAPVRVRRRDRDAARTPRRRLARPGLEGRVGRVRHPAVVVRRDRRPLPAQPGAGDPVDRDPLAAARRRRRAGGDGRGARPAAASALPSDASLAYPWREWAELIRLRAMPDPIAERVFRQAERVDTALPLDRLPAPARDRRPRGLAGAGPRVVRRAADADGEWRGGERGRQVTLRGDDDPDLERDADVGRPVPDRRSRATSARACCATRTASCSGRARVTSDASSGVEVAVLEGFSAVTGSGAAIRVEFDALRRLAVGDRPVEVAPPRLSPLTRAGRDTRAGTAPPVRWAGMQLIDGRPVYAATDLVGYLACEHLPALERAALAGLVEKPIRDDPTIDLDPQARLRARAPLPRGPARARPARRRDREGRVGRRAARRSVGGAAAGRRRGAAGGRRADDRGDARRRRRRLPGDVLRRHVARPRGLPAPARPRRRRARQRVRPVALRGRRHQARPPRQGLRDPPDLLVRRPADGDPGRPAGVAPRRPRRPRATRRTRCASTTTWPTTAGCKAASRPPSALRGDGTAARLPAGRRPTPSPSSTATSAAGPPIARRGAARTTTSASSRAHRRASGARSRRAASRPGEALGGLPLPMDPQLEGVGAGGARAGPRAGADPGRVRGPAARSSGSSCRRSGRRRRTGAGPRPARLPEPQPGDLFFDLEGDPFALDDGLDYLFGILEPRLARRPALGGSDGAPIPAFHAFWSLDDDGQVTWAAEKAAFERLIDLIIDRLERDPALHVYHYAAVRADRAQAARAAPRHARGGGRPAAPGRRARRPVPGRPAGHPGAASRATRSRSIEPLYEFEREVDLQGRRLEHRRLRDMARARREATGEDGDASSTGSRATTATTSSATGGCATGSRSVGATSRRARAASLPRPDDRRRRRVAPS